MNEWIKIRNGRTFDPESIPEEDIEVLRSRLASSWKNGDRIVDFFALPSAGNQGHRLFLFLHSLGKEELRAATCRVSGSYPSLSPVFPALCAYEREIRELTGLDIPGHPWPKAVRSVFLPGSVLETDEFLRPGTEEMHEVAVGPVHAGVIEPGHFRFLCHGEKIRRMQIQLGFQRRGIDQLILGALGTKEWMKALSLAGRIAGDSLIAHSWAHAACLEALAGAVIPDRAALLRCIALELERVATHTGDLGALCGDIAFLPGQSYFGGFRTLVINTMLEWCGARSGRGLISLGGVSRDIDAYLRNRIREMILRTRKDVSRMADVMFTSASVLSRFERCGVVSDETARELGLTGPSARASNILVDARQDHPLVPEQIVNPPDFVLSDKGDVFGRARVRYLEILQSLRSMEGWLDSSLTGPVQTAFPSGLAGSRMVLACVEGWRGEIVHSMATDHSGRVVFYRMKDPSLANWSGLEAAVRDNPISDFPVCNKSFNLSYCGHDL